MTAVEDDPATVTADALPTVQINGIVWDQEIVGDVVYAAGSFSSARPAGSPAGTNEPPRSNLLAYSLSTGELIQSFAPSINAQVRSVEASPDGTRLYIVGDFTAVDGQARSRVAGFDIPAGSLAAFNPNANSVAIGVDATNSTVYITGNFGRVNGQDRTGAAAISRDGTLLPWAPVLGERRGRVVLVSPDETKVVLGGDFPTLNGSDDPGYGLGMVSATDGSLIGPFQVNDVIRNAGNDAAILSLKSNSDSFYGTGYVFGSGGNLEGSFRASWETGNLTWVNDCHGDQYDVQPMGEIVYAAGHPHYCGSLVDGFPQSDPWTFYRAIAVTKDVERITPPGLNLGYYDFGGNPAPRLRHWFPTFNAANVSGAYQGPWTVNGNSEYLVYGGEFTEVNRTPQQGLVRFALKEKSTNEQGPRMWNTDWPTDAQSLNGAIRISWPTNYDRDSEYLTYDVLRDGEVIKTFEDVRSKSSDWGLPPMAYVDSAVESEVAYTYRIRATDEEGHSLLSQRATATATGTSTASAYRDVILNDQPLNYWPLDDSDPGISYDWAGASDLTVYNGVTRGADGAISGENRGAASFNGGNQGYASTTTSIAGPNTFGLEAWFKTTSIAGGKIIGFGNRSSGNSTSYDRHVYMEPGGRIAFGVYPGSSQTVETSTPYNDGEWHHVAAGLSDEGMVLYIDGVRAAQRADVTTAQGYNGYWRVGGDSSWSGSDRFAGDIDEVAVYAEPLSRSQVAAHVAASGRTVESADPPGDAYGASVFDLNPALYWRFGEASGDTAADSSGYGQDGSYIGDVSHGATGALDGVADTAAQFDGGQVISQNSYSNPRSYSLEAWFKTSTSTGGKIIGFGSSATGTSSNYDRHVYMTDTGQLVYGVWPGAERKIETSSSYNDDRWHHVVATQGAGGMVLYVDGEVVGSDPEPGAQEYTGYWHVGGDHTWGPGDDEFDGVIDEVAVYLVPIPAEDISAHYALGSTGLPPNISPTARFAASTAQLTVSVDGAASSDEDGEISEYRWDWGDGSPASDGIDATHTYTDGGSYMVTLTVTDDRGATSTMSEVVQVAPNQAPVASFTTSVDGLIAEFDASSSIDSDGVIEVFAWDWGDGTSEVGVETTGHTYAEDGTYTVTLTVTDDSGETATSSAPVMVAAPTGASTYARDDFNRVEATGFGSAEEGGGWTLTNSSSNYLVDGDFGVILQPAQGSLRNAYLPSVSSTDTAVEVDISFPELPEGGSAYSTVATRRAGSDEYRARAIVSPAGDVTVQLQATGTVLSNVPNVAKVEAGDQLRMRAEATGTSPTELRVKVWKVGTAEPAEWTATAVNSIAALQTGGYVGLGVYLSGSATNFPLRTQFDNFWAGSTESEAEPLENQDPVAVFSAEASGLEVAVDASGSGDPDGAIASYAWDFGDGATGAGSSAVHEYADAGSYEVTLTVTDDDGAVGSSTESVEVSEPAGPENQDPVAVFSAEASGLEVAVDASGSGDPDGAIASYAWDFGDGATGAGSSAVHEYADAGSYEVTLTVTDDLGATATTTDEVTVSIDAEAGQVVQDDFQRADGLLGTAPLGGTWTQTSGSSNVGIEDGRAKFSSQNASQLRSAALTEATTDNTDLTFSFAVSDEITNGRMYVSALGRVVDGNDYRARWVIQDDGNVQAQLSQRNDVMDWENIQGLTVQPNTTYHVRLQVFGVEETTVRSKIWEDGSAEPTDWQLTTTDSTPELQGAGHMGIATYAGGGFSPLPCSIFVDDFAATEVTP
ncbi:hypothetical protein BH708_14745 [Brachybacterium sp. P6-10-X1]|nr:hypothetical protein BH708_14745 [Brachybacterium sp. P6-10-X1]